MKKNSATIEKNYGSRILIWICICLAAAVISVYWPVYKFNFVKYDDDLYVTSNKHIQAGFNLKDLQWAFTSGYAGNWHPLTWLSHTFDYQLFKTYAGGHHLVNVLFHIINTILLFYVFLRMTKSLWPSVFVAAMFAIHPLHVESVAWVAERKDVLSTMFWLLTMLAYACYAEKPCAARYLTTLVLFAFGLMSKPMLVTLPFILLLLDYWPLERKSGRQLIIEKIPFFILSSVSCVITYMIQDKSGATATIEILQIKSRIANAIVSYVSYIAKMIWPTHLAALYPHPGNSIQMANAVLCGLLLCLLTVCFIYFGRSYKFLTFGWLWYLGTLVPTIGLVQVGIQSMADRYTYVPLTGLLVIIAFGAAKFIPRERHKISAIMAAVVLTICGVISARQVGYWKDSIKLFEHTLTVTKNNFHIYDNYASYLTNIGKYDQAIEQFRKLLAVRPDSAEAHNNLGCALVRTRRFDAANEQFVLAIKYQPNFAQAYYNYGTTLVTQHKIEESIPYFRKAVEYKPDYIDAWINMARVCLELKKFDEAVEICRNALKIDPDNVAAHGYHGMALAGTGKINEAISEINFVIKARPTDAEMYQNLGVLLERKGRTDEAIQAYRNSLKITPDNKKTQLLLDKAMKK